MIVKELFTDTLKNTDVLIVGSGFFGTTLAERIANVLNKKVTLIDSRSHIGGNCYSEIENETGIEYHKYGSHIFHTSSSKIWEYVNNFTKFNEYRHFVYTIHKNKTYSMPINLLTMSQFYGQIFSPSQAKKFLKEEGETYFSSFPNTDFDNFQDKAISSIGPDLYRAFIEGYTKKQWQINPIELPSSIISRLPVRFDFNGRYFSDQFEGIPLEGYTKMIDKMLMSKNISCFLNLDYFDIKHLVPINLLTIYTGPVDRFFNYSEGELNWRTLDFELEVVDTEDFQGTSVMNYSDSNVEFTRIHEFKHLHPERPTKIKKTLIMKEFSRFASRSDEPYYPINSNEDRKKLDSYRKLISEQKNVIFGGRLGSYQYLDMHMAIGSALSVFENQVSRHFNLKTSF